MAETDSDKMATPVSGQADSGYPKIISLDDDGKINITPNQMGEVQATPTEYTLLRRLKDLLTGIVLATGANVIGAVTQSGNWVIQSITNALPSGTNRIGTVSGVSKTISVTKEIAAAAGHTAEDVLCENATTGVPWTFAAIFRANNTGGYITKAQAICERTAITARLTLYLFNATPTSELRDNVGNTAPIHADAAKYLGKIDFPALEDLGGDSVAVATPSTVGNLPLWVDAASDADDIIGILVTRDNVTLTATDEIILKLTLEQY